MIASPAKMFMAFTLALLPLAQAAMAEVSTPSVFGDHMVLQAGKPLPVWGKADPGEAVTVTLEEASASTAAGDDGRWRVALPKRKTGGPLTMTIAGAANTLTYEDILVGEVWLGSGQSNMQWTVAKSMKAGQEIAAANYPAMRLFHVKQTIATTPQDDCEGAWVVCTPETIPDFSAVLYFFGRELHTTLDRPVGLIHPSWGGTPVESWTRREALLADPERKRVVDRWDAIVAEYPAAQAAYEQAVAEWTTAAEAAKAAGAAEPSKPAAPRGPNSSAMASGLYNAMIHPLVPYALRGAVWYQGENNAPRAHQYRNLFPAMIADWRTVWNDTLSFYYVQLANYTPALPEPADSDWAELREAQDLALAMENTGVAVTIDLGEAKDIHPTNKQDVGKRLALNALAKDYGRRVTFSGPTLKQMRVKGNTLTLTFADAKGGLVAKGDPLTGFAIAGPDKKFVWADAKIKGKRVVLSAPSVDAPVAVRYAWANNPVCNLYNKAGLPASPFRTDTWDGITLGKE
jgi:sialate O-acetylesterase